MINFRSSVTFTINLSSASLHSGVHLNGIPFFIRHVNGQANVAKSYMHDCWYPNTPSTGCTSLTEFNVCGQLQSPSILLWSILATLCAT